MSVSQIRKIGSTTVIIKDGEKYIFENSQYSRIVDLLKQIK